jgi:hypothetical protein
MLDLFFASRKKIIRWQIVFILLVVPRSGMDVYSSKL